MVEETHPTAGSMEQSRRNEPMLIRSMQAGDTFGDYEVVTRLQGGGMASLWLARRRGAAGFTRPVIIKIVHPHLATDEDFVKMFVDEAKIAARIDHPNIVHVEALGEQDGAFYMVMEYVHGASLAELRRALRKKGRAMGPAVATAIVMRIADGLHGAHETCDDSGELLNVVHRDVSPHNVLLSHRGHVKVIDFGVAKARGRSIQTTGGSLKGKIRYMSPEQAFGREVDRRTDIYALGIVLWELLTQRALFKGSSEMELLEAVRHPAVRPARAHNPAVSSALDAVLARTLAENPDDRPATAEELRQLLGEAIPEALAVDAARIAGLLQATVPELLASRAELVRASAPDASASVVSSDGADQSAQELIENLTISVELSEPSAVRDSSASRAVPATGPTPPMPAPVAPEASAWSRMSRGAQAAVLGVLLIAAVGAGFAAALSLTSAEEAPGGDAASSMAAAPPTVAIDDETATAEDANEASHAAIASDAGAGDAFAGANAVAEDSPSVPADADEQRADAEGEGEGDPGSAAGAMRARPGGRRHPRSAMATREGGMMGLTIPLAGADEF